MNTAIFLGLKRTKTVKNVLAGLIFFMEILVLILVAKVFITVIAVLISLLIIAWRQKIGKISLHAIFWVLTYFIEIYLLPLIITI